MTILLSCLSHNQTQATAHNVSTLEKTMQQHTDVYPTDFSSSNRNDRFPAQSFWTSTLGFSGAIDRFIRERLFQGPFPCKAPFRTVSSTRSFQMFQWGFHHLHQQPLTDCGQSTTTHHCGYRNRLGKDRVFASHSQSLL